MWQSVAITFVLLSFSFQFVSVRSTFSPSCPFFLTSPLFTCLSIYLFVIYLSVFHLCHPTCIPVYLSNYLYSAPGICLFTSFLLVYVSLCSLPHLYLPVYLFVSSSVRPCIPVSGPVYLYICACNCPSACLFVAPLFHLSNPT